MRATYSLGSLWGIRLGVNWSVLAVLGLLMWLLATNVFPATNPDLSANVHFVMAVVAALAFFGSVILHEVGHAIQARREGMEIDGITLWLLGGVATFRGGFPSAGSELRIAAAGPAVSALLTGLFIGLWFLPGLAEAVAGVAGWLAVINGALLLFNLVPALPLDGGRILRALIWRRRGDHLTATRVAARIAQFLAIGLMGLGIALVVVLGSFGGLWLALIGWFVLQASRGELVLAEREALQPRVADLMLPLPAAVEADQPLAELAERDGWTSLHPAYPVVRDGRLVGLLLTETLQRLPLTHWSEQTAAEHLVPAPELGALAPHDDLLTAAIALRASGSRAALVVADGRPVGTLVSSHTDDLLRQDGDYRSEPPTS